MYRLITALCLVGCTSVSDQGSRYRDVATPIYSSAILQAGDLAGNWVQVADFVAQGGTNCRAGSIKINRETGGGLGVNGRLCISGKPIPVIGRLAYAGPGRLALVGGPAKGIGQTWWVLWSDDSHRTAVVGTPSGDFGFILNRVKTLPTDRRRAAEEILDWNGYDISRLSYF